MTAAPSESQSPRLELVNLTKRFGTFVANDTVSLKLEPGTFHALLGENGAGKSTLVKCIMGYHLADAGDIIVGQSVRQIRSPYDAHKLGIALDFGAVDFIHSQLLEARNRNVAILLLSEDLDELVALSDRLVVMAAGKIVYSAPIHEIDRQLIGEKMASH
jgi:ABC-type uncharacterized transport system ATPase subunit